MITFREAKKMSEKEIREEMAFMELCHKEMPTLNITSAINDCRLALVAIGAVDMTTHLLENIRSLTKDISKYQSAEENALDDDLLAFFASPNANDL